MPTDTEKEPSLFVESTRMPSMSYLGWNDAIARRFFNETHSHRRVYLYVTPEVITEIGGEAGVTEFVSVVKAGPSWVSDGRLSVCGKAYRAYEQWKDHPEDFEYPPFIAYLALFALAAGLEGEFAAHAYYPRLHKLLGDQSAGMPPRFDDMWELWTSLQDWTEQLRGDLGEFAPRMPVAWEHVGWPVGQMLCSEEERHELAALFQAESLDPDSLPTELEMLAILRGNRDRFSNRTTKQLESSLSEPATQALVEIVLEELERWDGCTPAATASDEPPWQSASLRICLRVDTTAAIAKSRLRCKGAADLPECSLFLRGDSLSVTCDDHGFGWSTEAVHSDSHTLVDACELDWSRPLTLRDDESRWQASLAARDVRIFTSGARFAMPGFVEVDRVPASDPFLVAAMSKHWELLSRWGEDECDGFRELDVTGLPATWRLCSVDRARSDSTVRGPLPRLALPSTLRIRLIGGIRATDGRAPVYFSFAPPLVSVEGVDAGQIDWLGDRLESHATQDGTFILPHDAPRNTRVRYTARAPVDREASVSVELVDDFRRPTTNFPETEVARSPAGVGKE